MRDGVKEQAVAYWSGRAASFSELHARELESPMRELWEAELDRLLPAETSLDILDVGCGSGFFSVLLATRGHRVTGLDLTQDMLDRARATASAYGVSVRFACGDAECPALPEQSFDAIVTRNLTWNLPHIDAAYRSWHGLLRPGGVLVNFDGDYAHEHEDASAALPAEHAHNMLGAATRASYEHMRADLEKTQLVRPAWDLELLRAAGFADVTVDEGLSDRVYAHVDEFYNPTRMFALRAVRRA